MQCKPCLAPMSLQILLRHAVGLRSEAGAVGLRFEGAIGLRSEAGAVGLRSEVR